MASDTLSSDRLPRFLGWLFSLVVHGTFLVFLFFGVSWQRHQPTPMMAEIWSDVPKPATTREVSAPPVAPVTPSPPTPAPPLPAPPPPTPAPPVPKPPVAADTPKPVDIALKKKHQQAMQEEKKHELARQREKLLAEQLRQERLDALKEQRQDEQRRVEAEVRQRRTEQLAQNAQAAQAAQIDRYKLAIIQKIRNSTEVPEGVRDGLTLEVDITILPDGGVLEPVRIVKSSGDIRYDAAVMRGILNAQPLPLPNEVSLRRLFRVTHLQLHHEK